MKSLEEMREWLKGEIRRAEAWIRWLKKHESPTAYIDPNYTEEATKENIEMYQAILAALERKWPSVSKEFMGKWAKRFYSVSQRRDYVGTPDSTGRIITETAEEQLSKMLREAGVGVPDD